MMGLSRGTLIVVMICLTPVICQGIEEKNYRKISGIIIYYVIFYF